jgi:DNA-binding NtrC family response regulator
MKGDRILVVDDEAGIRDTVREVLEDEGYRVMTAEGAEAARSAVAAGPFDLALLDIWMPGVDGITLLKQWIESGSDMPVLMISGHGTVETAVEAIRLGAWDFLEKPLSTAKLLVTVERALQSTRLRRENRNLRRRLEPSDTLVGKSRSMAQLRETIARVAATDSWVLITGEPGSGKGVVARSLHQQSPRQAAAFVEISLAAVPPDGIAVQLFGAEEDGVVRTGSFEQARGGTLFLDEVCDLDLESQAKVVSALAESRFLRVGGRQDVPLDVRVLAATHQDIRQAVAEGRFREDLYYRLNVVPIQVPPLREHREDLPELIEFYVRWMVERERLPYRHFGTAALNALRYYDWPGNVRELKNLVQRLLILNLGEEVTREEIEQSLSGAETAQGTAVPEALFALPLREARDRFEKSYLEYHLQKTGGNVADVAEIVGMERTHLYRKLKGLGVDPRALKP